MAGYFATVLNVDATDDAAVAGALADVWNSASKVDGPVRTDIIVMAMVAMSRKSSNTTVETRRTM